MDEQEQSWTEQLNRRVRRYQDAGMDSYDAVAQAAADFNLSVLVEGDVCRVYEAPDGTLVNCWVNESVSNGKKGSSRFDNNISWYTSGEVKV